MWKIVTVRKYDFPYNKCSTTQPYARQYLHDKKLFKTIHSYNAVITSTLMIISQKAPFPHGCRQEVAAAFPLTSSTAASLCDEFVPSWSQPVNGLYDGYLWPWPQ